MSSNTTVPNELECRRVGVLLDGFSSWAGGIDFIRIILNGLLADPNRKVHLLIPLPTRWSRVRPWLGAVKRFVQSIIKGRPHWSRPTGFAPAAVARAFADFGERIVIAFYPDRRSDLVATLRARDVQVVLPAIHPLGADFPLPWVGYLFDFQHRHLPENFSPRERSDRDAAFAAMAAQARVVVVNAEVVRRDVEEHLPGAACRIVSLPFAPSATPDWLALDPEPERSRYGIPQRYFMVCNQFWIHKDHPTAIRAIAKLVSREGYEGCALVCTGGLHDYRHPEYAHRIRTLIEECGVRERVHLLGHIPKASQIALMRGAAAVVQPTLYEGGPGGGSAYDAVALGVPLLASDIPVNREISRAECCYFPPGDSARLAELMAQVLDAPPWPTESDELARRSHERLVALGRALDRAIHAAAAAPRHP